jgi:hypothetical protein
MLKFMNGKVRKALHRQLKLNEDKNLLHAEGVQLLEIDGTFLAALEELVLDSSGTLSIGTINKIAADAAASFVDKIYAHNQYIQIDNDSKELLKQIYVSTWLRIVETKDIESTIREYHYPKIRSFIKEKYPPALAEGLRSTRQLGRVPASEYTAELQLQLLGLDPEDIIGPLLDIGCGSGANLVRFLRSKAIEAYGIDRSVNDKNDYVLEADWFDYEYGSNKWGTIVSNLSFANHLVYAQRYDDAKVSRYLNTFFKVLESLKVDGTFVCAPAVMLLANQVNRSKYKIEIWEISSVVKGMSVKRVAL